MSRLTPFMKDLSTKEHRLAAAEQLMGEVYGFYDDQNQHWSPKPLADNKSRYLWTDSFGIVNYISLAYETGKGHYLDQAEALIKAVINTLGRHRGGHHQPRLGDATDEHPTLGGLRIGKLHDEGHSDGDGQYYHYLTKFAFALNRFSLAKKDPKYQVMAEELMTSVHPHFVQRDADGKLKMYWKLSIDLSKPAVPSEGHLDPYDGLVTIEILRKTSPDPNNLADVAADFAEMVHERYRRGYSSSDPLDLGEALWLTHFEEELHPGGWGREVARRSLANLDSLWDDGYFKEPAGYRLAFREFGTTLGVQVNAEAPRYWTRERVSQLHQFWAERVLERDMDISPVMMAASLVPGAWDKEFEENLVGQKGHHKSER